MDHQYQYLIIGGGLAGASAVEGIRKTDKTGTIGLLSAETERPYHRPPLSKDLLLGKKELDQIFVFDEAHYRRQKVALHLRTRVKSIQAEGRFAVDMVDHKFGYSKLLIATGGSPRQFPQAEKLVHTFRNIEDYLSLNEALSSVEDFLIIGGGFIGAELAAALSHRGKRVTVLLKGKTLLDKVLPPDLSAFVTNLFKEKGISFLPMEEPVRFEPREGRVKVTTQSGKELDAGWVIAGIGMDPETELARSAGLRIEKGVVVNRYLQTSRQEIFAAGDLARYPCEAIGEDMRSEHWDNAGAQGRCAGVNMAGGAEPYVHLPYFYSDLFELGFEAVGKLDPKMKTIAAWEIPFRKGVVVYMEERKVKGVLLWDQPKTLDWARGLITSQATPDNAEDLKRLLPALTAV